MKEYNVIIQVCAVLTAKNEGHARERADRVLDALDIRFPCALKRWMPEEIEKEINSIQEQ